MSLEKSVLRAIFCQIRQLVLPLYAFLAVGINAFVILIVEFLSKSPFAS